MKRDLRRFLADRSATTAIEYGLIAAGISLAIIFFVNSLGFAIKGNLNRVLGITVEAVVDN